MLFLLEDCFIHAIPGNFRTFISAYSIWTKREFSAQACNAFFPDIAGLPPVIRSGIRLPPAPQLIKIRLQRVAEFLSRDALRASDITLLNRISIGLRLIADIDQLLLSGIFAFILHGVPARPFDFGFRHIRARRNSNLLLSPRSEVFGRDLYNTIGINLSNVTSIWGTPPVPLRMPSRRKLPSFLLSRTNRRSPLKTLISTAVWNGAAVVNIWLCLVGIVESCSIRRLATPPTVSIERERRYIQSTIAAAAEPVESLISQFSALDSLPHSHAFIRLTLRLGSFPQHGLYLIVNDRHASNLRRAGSCQSVLASLCIRHCIPTGASVLVTRSFVEN